MPGIERPTTAQASPNVVQEGCELVASQEYNYCSTGEYDHLDVKAVKREPQRRDGGRMQAKLVPSRALITASTSGLYGDRIGSHVRAPIPGR